MAEIRNGNKIVYLPLKKLVLLSYQHARNFEVAGIKIELITQGFFCERAIERRFPVSGHFLLADNPFIIFSFSRSYSQRDNGLIVF